jgi:universal stress protein E
MDQIRSIVVGVDFSPGSAAAVRQAMRIAAWNRARLVAVHAIDPVLASEYTQLIAGFEKDVSRRLIDEVTAEWGRFAAHIPGAEHVPFSVDIDHPYTSMEKRIALHKVDLLVLGAHGATSPEHGVGTLASACVRRARAKVLLVRDTQPGPFRNVVACVDFSDTSQLALAQAVRVALQDEAFLHVIHVFDMPWDRMRRPAPPSPDVERRFREALPIRLRDFTQALEHEMGYIKPVFAVIEGRNHGEEIARYSRDLDRALVVLGTRGHADVHEWLVGSTAERVVRAAPCCILAIKPE